MKKLELAKRLAIKSHLTEAAAADQLDRIINDILKQFRKGKAANLPGLGTIRPNEPKDVGFEPPSRARKSAR